MVENWGLGTIEPDEKKAILGLDFIKEPDICKEEEVLDINNN